MKKIIRYTILATMVLILTAIPFITTGCGGQGTPPPPSSYPGSAADLSSTMVPNVDLDVYLYCKQASATKVPLSLIGASSDVTVESLALWGIANENKYSLGGALTFTNSDDASRINSQVSGRSQVWTRLSDRTIYFVQGSGGPGENLKSIISRNDFKKYSDSGALQEVAMMPNGGSTVPAAVGVIKPNQAMVDLVKRYVDASTAGTVDTIFTWAKPEIITFGLYSSSQIDIADLAQRLGNGTIWDVDLGGLISVRFGVPGIVVSPVATKYLENAGYPKETLGQLTVYKGSLPGKAKMIPVLYNVDGNHIFASVSAKESYAQTLMTGIKR